MDEAVFSYTTLTDSAHRYAVFRYCQTESGTNTTRIPAIQAVPGTIGQIVSYTSVNSHFQSFPQGVIESKDVIYYLTLVIAGIVLSTLSLQSRRYR